jgi:hypothetical protein
MAVPGLCPRLVDEPRAVRTGSRSVEAGIAVGLVTVVRKCRPFKGFGTVGDVTCRVRAYSDRRTIPWALKNKPPKFKIADFASLTCRTPARP